MHRALFIILFPGALSATAMEQTQLVTPPVDGARRLERFAARNDRAQLRELADLLAGRIDLSTPGIRDGFSQHYAAGDYAQALGAYRDYFFAKLRDPGRYGIPSNCIASRPPQTGRSSADDLMANRVTARLEDAGGKIHELKFDIGAPGAINWLYIPPGWQDTPVMPGQFDSPDYNTPDTKLLPNTPAWRKLPAAFARCFRDLGEFNALLIAYGGSRDRAYLEKWAEYADDWVLHQRADAECSPHNISLYLPQQCELFDAFLGSLKQLDGQVEGFATDLPAPTLVRVLLRRLEESSATSARQLRTFEANWRHMMATYLVRHGLFFSEFRIGDWLVREGRRGYEESAVVCVLPDGTDYELTPNYLHTHLNWGSWPLYQTLSQAKPDWFTSDWIEVLKEDARSRTRFLVRNLMADGRWPILGPQDRRSQLAEYTAPFVAEFIPEVTAQTDHARMLNRAYAGSGVVFGSGETSAPRFTSDWFPYTGYYYFRSGWERDDQFMFMKSAYQAIGHGGPWRLWENNNALSLYAFGEELLFIHHETPLRVDGFEQDSRFGLPFSGHIGYILAPPPQAKPTAARWHSSEHFDFAEGVYDGRFGVPGEHVVNFLRGEAEPPGVEDVTHTRQVLHLKEHGLWILLDRIDSPGSHEYEQKWMLHVPERDGHGPIHGFTEEQLEIDAERSVVRTHHPTGPNLSLYQISAEPLTYSSKIAPPNDVVVDSWRTTGRDPEYLEPGNYVVSFTISRLDATWWGTGDQMLITVLFPRARDDIELADFRSTAKEGGIYGFEATLPTGERVQFEAAVDRQGAIGVDGLSAVGEGLLSVTELDGEQRVLAIACESLELGDHPVGVPAADVEFRLTSDQVRDAVPIFRPIDPVRLEPDIAVFEGELAVVMSSASPDVDILYTLDGSDPTVTSTTYDEPVVLRESTTVKARAYRRGVTEDPHDLSGTQATVVSRARFTRKALQPAIELARDLQPGLAYEYFEDSWQRLFLWLDECVPVRTGVSAELLDVGVRRSDGSYAIRHEGWFRAPADGVYTFYAPGPKYEPDELNLEHGFDMRVWIDDEEWYPATDRHAFGTWSVALSRGVHSLKIVYVDFRGGKPDQYTAAVEFGTEWAGDVPTLNVSGPGIPRGQLPASMLSFASADAAWKQ